MTKLNIIFEAFLPRFLISKFLKSVYSKTPIYRASRGKGKKPGKSGDTVNRGMEKIVQDSVYLRFKTINYAKQLHKLVYAVCGLTYSTQNVLGKYF